MIALDSKSRTDFLSGTGEMGERIRAFDWTRTPLGVIETWPLSLKTSVSLILGSRHPMWIGWGPEMTFLYNDAYLHVLGLAKHERALGRPASEVWAEIWDVCGPLADKVFESGEASFVDDVRLFMDRGDFLEETFYSFSYSPIRDEAGTVCGLFCPSTDVTPKVVNTRRLRTLSELATNALTEKTTRGACATTAHILSKNADDVPFALLYLTDASGKTALLEQKVGRFTSADGIAESIDLTAFSPGQPWPIAEVFRTARRQIISVRDAHGLPLGVADQPVSEAVVVAVSSRGEHEPYGVLVVGVNPCRPLDTDHLTFFELVAGQVATAIQNASEVEEEKKRADMLAEIDRAKTVFFSNVSHEFRTPLTLMLGPLENLLANPAHLRPDDREHLLIAHRNSLRLLKLVNSLLDFSRIEAGRIQASYEPTDLSNLTANLASSFQSAMAAAGLDFIVDCEPLTEPVHVDHEMWEKIVLNLLSNAFKFTFEGTITVRLRHTGQHAVLTVSDTGIGIPEAELPRIFERFHRVEGARGRTWEGTGIGLALIQEFVKVHGGTISVASQPGAGSTFTISIPLGTAHLPGNLMGTDTHGRRSTALRAEAFIGEAITWLPRNGHSAESRGAASPSRGRVLLADDNADMREHVARILGSDYELVTASDGRQALEQIRLHPPDLVLTDVMMPGLDGLELLRTLRSNPQTQTIPVIFVSARAGENMRVEGLEAGADDYLVKPFTGNELRARVGTHVQMAKARRHATERETQLRAEAEAARDQALNSERNFRRMIDALPAAIYTTNAEGRLTHFNPAAVELSGRVPELGTDQWWATWKPFLPDGMPLAHGAECVAERPDGTRFWFIPYPTPLRDEEGRVIGGINMFVDITARKQAEASLREGEERFRAIVETTPECVKVVAADGTLQHMNSSGLAMVGASCAADVIGKNVFSLIAPEFRDAFRRFNETICRGEKGSLEFDIIGLQGERRHMETHAAPLNRPDGTVSQLAITRDVTERKLADRATRLLGAIVDSSDDAIISKDLNGIITSWNKGARSLFGYTADEAVGRSILLLIPADRIDEEAAILSRLKRGERVDHFETVRQRKDGTLRDISLTISPVKDAQGKIIGVSKIARDISDRRRAEKAIQKLNTQLTAELSAMTRMQQISTRLVQTDDFADLLGEIIDAAIEITGADIGDIQLLEGGALQTELQRGAISDSVPGTRTVRSTPLVSRSGQVLGVFSTHYREPRQPGERELRLLDLLARQAADLIENKVAESALRASEGRFRQLADAMPQIVWTARSDGYIDYYNERWHECTGLKDNLGDISSWEPALHPDDVRRCRDTWYESVRSGEPYRMECRFRDRAENRWRWFMGRALPVRNNDGVVVKWFGTCTDIDEQKRVEDELRRANQDLEQFAYSASHDLQEPLRTIKIFGELLTKSYSSRLDGEALEFLEYLRAGATRMETLVRDLLAYTQVTRFDIPIEPGDANEALAAALANLSGAISESDATITWEPLPSIRVDGTHLRQLFQNLIGNAIKYRSPGRAPVVHVSSERQNGAWVFSVSDNGIGIQAEYKEHIFGLFKRLHTSYEYSGTGIGLAICQRIVERYSGRIRVESEPGQGSTFIFSIPV